MRIVFLGTPDYSVPSLKALAASHEIAGVVTQPDRPKGRHGAASPPPVKACALALGIPAGRILQPERPNGPETIEALRAMSPDVYCVVAYGNLLKDELLAIPRICPLNAHGSLLPKHRGAAPIQAAILAGDKETGVTMMRMVRKMDAGPILLARSVPIGENYTAGTLHDRLADLSAQLFIEGLALIESGRGQFIAQDESRATIAPKLTKDSGKLDFSRPAAELERAVRAYHPWPVAWAELQLAPSRKAEPVRVHAARIVPPGDLEPGGKAEPGRMLACDSARGIVVACGGDSALRLARVQLAGKHTVDDTALMRGLR